LLAHGNAGNVTHRAGLLRDLHDQLRTSVFCFDYRGYGRSEGKPDEQGALADARAARAWLAARAGIPERQIVLMGESLGGGVAVDLAAVDGARGLVLKSTFSSIRDVAAADFPCLSGASAGANPFRLGRKNSELSRPTLAIPRRQRPHDPPRLRPPPIRRRQRTKAHGDNSAWRP